MVGLQNAPDSVPQRAGPLPGAAWRHGEFSKRTGKPAHQVAIPRHLPSRSCVEDIIAWSWQLQHKNERTDAKLAMPPRDLGRHLASPPTPWKPVVTEPLRRGQAERPRGGVTLQPYKTFASPGRELVSRMVGGPMLRWPAPRPRSKRCMEDLQNAPESLPRNKSTVPRACYRRYTEDGRTPPAFALRGGVVEGRYGIVSVDVAGHACATTTTNSTKP